MRLTVKTTNIERTKAIERYLSKRMAELDRVLSPNDESHVIHVELGKSTKHHKTGKDLFFAEITFHLKRKDFRAVASDEADLYAAIDKMKDEIVREVTTYHDRLRARAKAGGRELKRRIQG